MIAPELELDPVIPPLMGPIVQLNVLDVLDVRVMLGANPLQIVSVGKFVTIGVGSTITVMVNDGPGQLAVEVGVTIYGTVPDVVLLGLVSI